MKNLLVEDTISKFPYQLLTPIFGEKLKGSNGNKNIESDVASSSENTVVLVDVSPDNMETILSYTDAIDAASSLHNVFVIPYPCIEYCFIRALIGYADVDMTAVITFENYILHTRNIYKKQLNTKNYEKFCKSVVHLYKKCMRNDVFVTSDCFCDEPLNDDCYSITLKTKQYKMCYGLPIYLLSDDTDDKFKNRVKASIEEGESVYYKMAERFLSYGIIECIQPLPANPGLL